MTTPGTFICDGCERPISDAHLIPLSFHGSEAKTYTFAFCTECNNIPTHQRVLSAATKRYQEWKTQNRSK
jgi:hypothetical protein